MSQVNLMKYFPQIQEVAIDEQLLDWQAQFPCMGVCVLLPEANKAAVAELQAICIKRNIALVGGIFPALLKEGEFLSAGVWLLCFTEMPYYALYENLPTATQEVDQITRRIATELREQIDDTPDVTLFMLFDAMVPNIASILDQLYLYLANRVHYAGANAGSETFQRMPCLFDRTRIVENGMLLLLLKAHRGAILEHGYVAPQHSVYASSTEGNRIAQIDWRPAFEVYQELVQKQFNVEITAENFYQHSVHFPFGIMRANHHVVVRIPVALSDDGSLFCVGEVPANAMLTLLEAPRVDTRETLRVLMDGIQALNGDPAGTELLLFYCAGRRAHLGAEQSVIELQEFAGSTQAAQVSGAVSLGEIGGSTLHGYPLFHNATLVASSWNQT
ncbi:MAG: FIST C-terminal domain-containing protein [Gallionellaceae bacterium]|jgi:hypothetical protein